MKIMCCTIFFFFFQAEDGIRDLVRSRGLGDVYKRQLIFDVEIKDIATQEKHVAGGRLTHQIQKLPKRRILSLIHI